MSFANLLSLGETLGFPCFYWGYFGLPKAELLWGNQFTFFMAKIRMISVFLNRLGTDEKKAFLNLAHHMARVDGDLAKAEEIAIEQYCAEMQIEDSDFDAAGFNLTDTLNCFQSRESKKIALLEIMALVYADGVLAEKEESTLRSILEHFDISPALATVYKEWSKSILSLYVQGEALIRL